MLLAATMFFGCGPNDQTILKKYETHIPVEPAVNKAGISAVITDSVNEIVINISYSHPALNFNEGNVNILSERLFVANVENPSGLLDVKFVTDKHESASNDSTKTSYFSTVTVAKETAAKYALVCFKGIDKSEFERAETPPCFFIVSLDKANPHVLTDIPLLAGDLVVADYTKSKFIRFVEPQIYSGTVSFEKSKNVELQLTLSADATQVTELKLIADELYLSIQDYVELNDKSTIEFRSFGSISSSFNGNGITNSVFKGRIEATSSFEILDDKIVSNDVTTCDLSVTDACIYGTVKITMFGCATKQIYAVLRNITTPQEVPENILEPLKK
jgi:hypothetical protein